MSKIQMLLILLLCCPIIQSMSGMSGTTPLVTEDKLVIQSVSVKLGQRLSQPVGSVLGGQTLYIQAIGLDQTPGGNEVMIGDQPCLVAEKGVNGPYLACITTKLPADKQELHWQPITIKVAGKEISTCTAGDPCYYSYSFDETPLIRQVTPRSNYAGRNSWWRGRFKVSDTSDESIMYQKLGDFTCDKFNFIGGRDEQINSWDDDVQCQIAGNIEAGDYRISSKTQKGLARVGQTVQTKNVANDNVYDARILPKVDSLDTNIVSPRGQVLQIKGTGFSSDPSKVQVTAAGTTAEVLSSSPTEIRVLVPPPEAAGFNQPSYFSGAGLEYTRYDLQEGYWTCDDLRVKVLTEDAKLKELILENVVYPEPQADNSYGTNYGQFWQGFFKAPKTGKYRFYVVSDDCGSIWIQTTAGSTDTATMKKISHCNWGPDNLYWWGKTQYPNDYEPNDKGEYETKEISQQLDLEQGKYYLIHFVNINSGGTGYFRASVEIENTDTFKTNSLAQIQTVKTSYNARNRIVELNVYNQNNLLTLTGNYKIQVPSGDPNNPTRKSSEISPTATGDDIKNIFAWQLSYQTSVERVKLGTSGNVLADTETAIAGYRYTITFVEWLENTGAFTIVQSTLSSGAKAEIQTTQEAGSPISGTYSLSINGEDITIWDGQKNAEVAALPYSIDTGSIAYDIWYKTGVYPVYWSIGRPEDGIIHYFQMRGFPNDQPVPQITVTATNLVGGASGKPTVTQSIYQERSKNLLFEPIPSELLFVGATKPQVQVTVNGILGSCEKGQCDYTLSDEKTPTLNSFTRSGATLTLVLTNPGQLTLSSSTVTVTHAGQPCTITNVSGTTITCSVATLNNQPILEAGDHVPKVSVDGIGFVKIANGVTAEVVPLIFTSVSPVQGSLSGGTLLTITGTGFAASSKTPGFVIKVGGVDLVVVSVTNTQVTGYTPAHAAGVADVTIQFNSKTATKTFTYSDASTLVVSGVNPATFSPINKGQITITGSNFGSTKADIVVQLVAKTPISPQNPNEFRIFDLNVNTVSNTQIVAYLGGGVSGQYTLRVRRNGWGYSKAQASGNDNFEYLITVSSITPTSGSKEGGTLITIAGTNFKLDDTQVFIGEAVNWVCDIQSVTETQIKCITPPKHDDYTPETQLNVHVFGRLTEEAKCTGTCKFAYANAKTPTVNRPDGLDTDGRRMLTEEEEGTAKRFMTVKRTLWSEETLQRGHNHLINHFHPRRNLAETETPVVNYSKEYKTGDTQAVTGTGLTADTEVWVGETKATVTNPTTTSLTFTFPSLPAGVYPVKVLVPGNGYGSFTWNARVTFFTTKVGSGVDGVDASSIGGSYVVVEGSGFNTEGELPSIVINDGAVPGCIEFAVVNHEKITCQVPPVPAGQVKLIITQRNTDGKSVSDDAYYTASATSTITSLNLAKVDNQYTVTYADNANTFLITATGTQLNGNAQVNLRVQDGTTKYTGTISSKDATTITTTFTSVPIGNYVLQVVFDNVNLASSSSASNGLVRVANTIAAPTVVDSSYAGGATLTFTGKGFSAVAAENSVTVCGLLCQVGTASFTTLSCETPALLTDNVSTQYKFQQQATRIYRNQYTITGSKQQSVNLLADGLQSTSYKHDAACNFQFDFGSELALKLKMFRFMPESNFDGSKFAGVKIESSTDGTTFTTLTTLDNNVHQGWNFFVPTDPVSGIKVLRFSDSTGASKCSVAEVQLTGWLLVNQNPTVQQGLKCPVQVKVNGYATTAISERVQYSDASTPKVTAVSPKFGSTAGGTTVTITGTGFTAAQAQTKVLVDNVYCVVTSVSSTSIQCTTGEKDLSTNTDEGLFEVRIGGQRAANQAQFLYGNLFSAEETWGGDIPPREGDLIFVPKGQLLVIDQDTPVLNTILVEGGLTFSDDKEISLDAKYILIRMGKFWIGSEGAPYQNKLTITLHGNILDVQLPDMGNKVLGCHECTLDIHGKQPSHHYTLLSSTADAGATQITVDDTVNWQVGDLIVIASGDYAHLQSERRIIKTISGKTITFDEPLVHRHYSAVETYGQESFPMKVEVALLSRNVVIQGDPNDSPNNQYGAHMMIHGKAEMGSIGRIENAEFRNSGQPKVLGRYPIHFHLNSEVYDSYVRWNVVHDSYARCITIHGVSYLRVQNNVGYNANGHMVFLEDGIETNNIITGNLMIGAKQSWIMLQSDITAATYWITNPNNIVTDNRSGGSEWYGFWYEIKQHPDGPSACSDICPPGLKLGKFENNVAHSNGKYGLRILEMIPRQFPCEKSRDDTLPDPFSANPAFESVFLNFITWKNNEDGVLGEELGDITFRNFQVADSRVAGFQTHRTNYTSRGALIDNVLIVGKSINNAAPNDYYKGTAGIIAARTNGLTVQNVRFWNFGEGMHLLHSCSVCWHFKLWVTGGKNTKFSNLQFFNSDTANVIFWEPHRREIFWDTDGSIASKYLGYPTTKGTFITPYKKHFDGVDGCTHLSEDKWDDSVVCKESDTLKVRDILINNPVPAQDFENTILRIGRLDAANEDITFSEELDAGFTEELMFVIKKSNDIKWSYASSFVTNQIYNVHWNRGIDFRHLGIQPSEYLTEAEPGIVLRFNYSSYRETYDIFSNTAGKLLNQKEDTGKRPDPADCYNGQFFNNIDNKLLYLCVSGKQKARFDYIDVDSVICRDSCSSVAKTPIDKFFTPWSSPNAWENGKVPQAGDRAITKPGRKVLFDVKDSGILDYLEIQGELHFDNTQESSTLQAKNIYVRGYGYKIIAGSEKTPFTNDVNIILHGTIGGESLVIDDKVEASNKELAVTGGLELYGSPPESTWTRLTKYASAGDTTITVASAAGWKAKDVIALGPSGRDQEQREKHIIKSVSGNVVTLQDKLAFDHYGAPGVTIDKGSLGKLDMRTGVAHLSRNIKISGNKEGKGWGCRVLVYAFTEEGESMQSHGYARLDGVEFENCGQFDSSRAALDLRSLDDTVDLPNVIKRSSFHDSTGMQISAQNSYALTIDNNVFFNAMKAFVYITDVNKVTISNNLFIYVTQRPNPKNTMLDNWAVFIDFVVYTIIDPLSVTSDNINVFNNVGQGSQDSGFFFMSVPCDLVSKPAFYDNECSASVLSCFAVRQSDPKCSAVTRMSAYNSYRGVMAAMSTEVIRVSKVILAENDIGIAPKTGVHDHYDNTFFVDSIYITALARPDCKNCYKPTSKPNCKDQIGFRLASISTSAFPPDDSHKPSGVFDVICTVQQIDGRLYMTNVEFENFKSSYGTGFEACGSNHAFSDHPGAVDVSVAHFLKTTKCTSCDQKSLFLFNDPPKELLGWEGGCGSFNCTGLLNSLVTDKDGTFLGSIGQAFSNNKYLGPNITDICTKVDSWNGYSCKNNQLSVLNWLSIAPDSASRLFSPVTLTDGFWFNQVNSLKEWNWDGPEPLNTRESSFTAIVRVNGYINMTNAGKNPTDAHFWLTKRDTPDAGGSPDDYVIIKLQYTDPASIIVSNDYQGANKVIKPFISNFPDHQDLKLHKSECGANNYFRNNNTIHFVVTGSPNCLVRVKQVNSVLFTSRLSLTYDDYWAGGNKNVGSWLTLTATLMGIDNSRIKIVGVKSVGKRIRMLATGSDSKGVELDVEISDDQVFNPNKPDTAATNQRLNSLINKYQAAQKNPELTKKLETLDLRVTQQGTPKVNTIDASGFVSTEESNKTKSSASASNDDSSEEAFGYILGLTAFLGTLMIL